jgi:flagellar hook-basal body complex protein FliE
MADMQINGINTTGIGQQPSGTEPIKADKGGSFEAIINEALGKVSQVQDDMEKAVKELAAGDITAAIIAAEKAEMTFQLMVEVRNKLISAYEEVMRMQV